jgi:hypothetical protein
MISANNSFGNNVGNAQPNEKRNWKIGRMFGKYTADTSKAAVLEVGLYKSPYAVFCTLSIRTEMGKDSKGRVQFETGLNKENPSCLLNVENVAGVLQLCDYLEKDPGKVSQLNFQHDGGRSKLNIKGSETETTFTVTSEIGSKSITFEATPAGFMNVHGWVRGLKELLKVVQKKQLTAKLDPEEFGTNNDSNDGEDVPF